jgi:hypothetical protein
MTKLDLGFSIQLLKPRLEFLRAEFRRRALCGKAMSER